MSGRLSRWRPGDRPPQGRGAEPARVAVYLPAQIAGVIGGVIGRAIGGAVLVNVMFAEPLASWSSYDRSAPHCGWGKVVAPSGTVG